MRIELARGEFVIVVVGQAMKAAGEEAANDKGDAGRKQYQGQEGFQVSGGGGRGGIIVVTDVVNQLVGGEVGAGIVNVSQGMTQGGAGEEGVEVMIKRAVVNGVETGSEQVFERGKI